MTDDQLLYFVTSRAEIEACDTTRFLSEFGLSEDKTQSPRWPMGSVMFSVDGYNDDPDDLYSIPAVRAFYLKVHRQWPCWIYYSELATESLKIIALCVIDTISSIRSADERSTRVVFPPEDLHQFVADGLDTFAILGERAGLSGPVLCERIHDVMTHFGFARLS